MHRGLDVGDSDFVRMLVGKVEGDGGLALCLDRDGHHGDVCEGRGETKCCSRLGTHHIYRTTTASVTLDKKALNNRLNNEGILRLLAQPEFRNVLTVCIVDHLHLLGMSTFRSAASAVRQSISRSCIASTSKSASNTARPYATAQQTLPPKEAQQASTEKPTSYEFGTATTKALEGAEVRRYTGKGFPRLNVSRHLLR